MKILYDHQIFDSQSIGGISRYIYELLDFFNHEQDVTWELPLMYSNNQYITNLPLYKNILPSTSSETQFSNFLWNINFKGKNRIYNLKNKLFYNTEINFSEINKFKSIEKIKEGNYDVFHPTYYDNYFLDFIGNKPFVLTVHDLIHQIFPEYGLYETKDKNKRMLERANKIITVSASTKSDLINIFDLDERKIEIIHLANSLNFDSDFPSDEFQEKLPEKYLLYVGNRDNYKNFLFFTQVYAALGDSSISVVCTGALFNSSEKYLFEKLGIKNQLFSFRVDDVELSYLYKNAIAMIFPSMYEGFGLPILEAFSCGCPVLSSNSSSLTEVGGDAATYFQPKSALEMLSALKKVINDKQFREDKITKGYKQLSNFSWKITGSKTKKVYEDVLFNKN